MKKLGFAALAAMSLCASPVMAQDAEIERNNLDWWYVTYANFDDDFFIVGPTPDSNYAVELHYGYYPESIVTANTTWLGDEFDSALLNGALVQAIRFMKGEADMLALYTQRYGEAVSRLKVYGEGQENSDAYRDGLPRVKRQ